MKKFFMIAALMVVTLSANAQNEVGVLTLQPKVGMNLANMTGDGDQKTKVGLLAGVEAEYGISEKFGLAFGALYSMEGYKVKRKLWGNVVMLGKQTLKANLDYINIPILAQFYPVKGLAIKAGVQPAFNVRHKAGGDADGTIEGVKTFNFSIPVGLSYEYEGFVLDARYNIGITKLYKDADQGRNSTFSISLGYKIPF